MWKLTITQNTKEKNYVTDNVEFMSDDITDLTSMIYKLSRFASNKESSYKIEKEGEADE